VVKVASANDVWNFLPAHYAIYNEMPRTGDDRRACQSRTRGYVRGIKAEAAKFVAVKDGGLRDLIVAGCQSWKISCIAGHGKSPS
jgi:hypothetical protein